MCLIVISNKTNQLTEAFVNNVMKRNNDGWGIMWTQKNKVRTYKSHVSDPKQFFDYYKSIAEHEPVIHFRMKTHGEIDHENTHPFYCGFGIWLMHNGVLQYGNPADKTKSDTWHFTQHILNPLFSSLKNPHKFIRSWTFQHLIEDYLGHSNRIILGDRGGFIYFNSNSWFEIKDNEFGMEGTIVSNNYAWDSHELVNKETKEEHISKRERKRREREARKIQGDLFTFNTNYRTTYSPYSPGPIKTFRFNDNGLTHLYGNYWYDDLKHIWEEDPEYMGMQAGCWERRDNLQYDDLLLAKETAPETKLYPIIVKNPEINNEEKELVEEDSNFDEVYADHLVKEWGSANKDEVLAMVYNQPDDAALVIDKLLHKN